MPENEIPKGTLYLVATPIGNLEDISIRALSILKGVDLVACEDTRRTALLLEHYGIRTPRESHHEHNEARHSERLMDLLLEGKSIALVSDAGTPLLSDPGYVLVRACREACIDVVPVPGPSAAMAALTASGFPTDSFLFVGFLPSKHGARRKRLAEVATVPATLILYEAPHRILRTLEELTAALGDRQACLARELTKIHEEWLRGSLSKIAAALRLRPQIRGEITLVVDRTAPAVDEAPATLPPSLAQDVENEMKRTGASRKESLKSVARQRGISRKEAYRQLLLDRKH